jgi:hypothetical protein
LLVYFSRSATPAPVQIARPTAHRWRGRRSRRLRRIGTDLAARRAGAQVVMDSERMRAARVWQCGGSWATCLSLVCQQGCPRVFFGFPQENAAICKRKVVFTAADIRRGLSSSQALVRPVI